MTLGPCLPLGLGVGSMCLPLGPGGLPFPPGRHLPKITIKSGGIVLQNVFNFHKLKNSKRMQCFGFDNTFMPSGINPF